MSQSRQLAAIMFTDIVGYTALMGKDSNKALGLVRISKEIQKPLVEKHHGQWLKEMGDGALVKFDTALDAVNCAFEIQELARAKLDGRLRIGIHSGDITIDNNDVYGDGVNVASRLESIADPGGIYISDAIEKAIRGQTDIQAKYLGEVQLKNVAYSVRTYAVQGVGLPIPGDSKDKELRGHLWAEIQRRGMIRVALTYLVIGILSLLLLREAQNWITLPDWSPKALIFGLLLFFPVAMYLAWMFERGPEGFIQTSSQASWRNPFTTARRKPLTGFFAIASLILLVIFVYFYPGFKSSEQQTKPSPSSLGDVEKSIAVLPFRDISPNKDQEWFSDGVMEAILDHITKIPGLKVTSRTSVMRYRNSNKSIPEIAKELGVNYLLEGGVQVYGDQVRITAQLIDTNDKHLWSEQYDQPYKDIFSIQSEVAQKIASVIEVSIGPAVRERMLKVPTDNMEAYNYFLKAGVTDDIWVERWKLYEQAIKLDPGFAEAYARYGYQWFTNYTWASVDTLTTTQIMNKSLTLLKKALELDPNLAVAHKSLGDLYCWGLLDLKAADKEYQIAQSLKPSDPQMTNPQFLIAIGRFQEALAAVQKQIASDPQNIFLYGGHTMALYFDDQINEALVVGDGYLRKTNFHGNTVYMVGRVFLWAGEYQKVAQMYEQHPNDFARVKANAAIAYFKLGQRDKAAAIVESLKNRKTGLGSPAYCLGLIFAQMGEIDNAFEWLEKAYEERQGELYWLKEEPPFEPLYSDPRWHVLLNKVGFPQ